MIIYLQSGAEHEKKLEKSEEKTSVTKDEFKKMGYQERLNFKKSNPELFKEFMKG